MAYDWRNDLAVTADTYSTVTRNPWDNRTAADITEESFDSLRAEIERYKRNPLNLTTEQLAEIARISKELSE